MTFKFSLRRLFFITTVVAVIAVIAAICDRLGLFGEVNSFVVVLVSYCLIYAGFFAVFLLPRYWHQWKEFRKRLNELGATRSELEKEVQRKIDLLKESVEVDTGKTTLVNQGASLPE